MTWSHRVWEQTPTSMVPQIAELVHVCLSKINWYISWSCVVPGFSSYILHHFTSFCHTFLKWMPWILQGGSTLTPDSSQDPVFRAEEVGTKGCPRKSRLSDMGSGYGHFWCGWVFRCYTTVTTKCYHLSYFGHANLLNKELGEEMWSWFSDLISGSIGIINV